MNTFKTTLAFLVATALTGAASADVISLNITGGGAGDVLASTDEVGVVSVANWNNTGAPSGNIQTVVDLVDDSGTVTATDATLTVVPSIYNNNTPAMTGDMVDDAIMMRTSLGSSQSGNARKVEFVDVPYALYDVYVYFAGPNQNGSVPYKLQIDYQILDGANWTTEGDTLHMIDNNRQWDGTYNESTATADGDAVDGEEYVVFRNKTASVFRVIDPATGRRGGLAGVQIVEVPEPGSLALMGLGGLMILGRRKAM